MSRTKRSVHQIVAIESCVGVVRLLAITALLLFPKVSVLGTCTTSAAVLTPATTTASHRPGRCTFVRRRTMWFLCLSVLATFFLLALTAYNFLDSNALRYILPRASLSVERVTIPMAGLARAATKVIQISDVHTRVHTDEPTQQLWSDVHTTVKAERPDLVVVTGDVVDYEPAAVHRLIPFLKLLQSESRFGLYVSLGNHDSYAKSRATIITALETAAIPVLHNSTAYPYRMTASAASHAAAAATVVNTGPAHKALNETTTTAPFNFGGGSGGGGAASDDSKSDSATTEIADSLGLAVVGLGDIWAKEFHPEEVLPHVPAHLPRIILSHNPDTSRKLRSDGAYRASSAERWQTVPDSVRSDLILSGHTHGGQICWPHWLSGARPNRGRAVLTILLWLDSVLPKFIGKYLPGRRYYGVVKNWDLMQGLFTFTEATPDAAGSYLYVNRGLADVHRRLYCDPELTVFNLVPAQAGVKAAITTGTTTRVSPGA